MMIGGGRRNRRWIITTTFLFLSKTRGGPTKTNFFQATDAFIGQLVLFSLLTQRILQTIEKSEHRLTEMLGLHKQNKPLDTDLATLLHDPSTQLTILLPRLGNVAVTVNATIIQQFGKSMFPAHCRGCHFPVETKSFQLLNAKLRKRGTRLGSTRGKLSGSLELCLSVIFTLHLDPFA